MEPTATAMRTWINSRPQRAESLAHAIVQAMNPYLDPERRSARRDAFKAVLDLLREDGIEVLRGYDRLQMGLPPVGPDGWTLDEILALEKQRAVYPPDRPL